MTIDFSKYKHLDEIEHVLLRPGRYLGATAPSTTRTYLFSEEGKVTWGDVSFSPAFLKLFDEVLTNSVDHSKTPEGKHLNRIDINVNKMTGSISVIDNGGIPVVKHPENDMWLPDMLLGQLRSGSNFNDEEASEAAGQNGEGASLTGIFSTDFIVETADGKNRFNRLYSNNFKDRGAITIEPSKKKYTRIEYYPDMKRLGIEFDSDHFEIIRRRAYEVAACNPGIRVSFNNKPIDLKSFKDFAVLFDPEVLYFESDKWQVALGYSGDGLKHIAFVNSTMTFVGGTHIDHVATVLTEGVRAYIQKKTKQEIRPSQINGQFFMFINMRTDKPRYSSQTKENLTTPISSFSEKFQPDDKFFKKLIASDITKKIIEWAENKKALEDMAALRNKLKDGKKKTFNDILKYDGATEKVDRSKCTLIIAEGDSAVTPLLEARDPRYQGVFPMRGKAMNVRDVGIAEVKKNAELINLMRIIGLEIGKEPVLSELRYGRLLTGTDQDWDGHHIKGLVLNLFQTFWPSLLKSGFVCGLETPLVRVTQGKNTIEFAYEEEFVAWQAKQSKPFTARYLKGVGSNTPAQLTKYLNNDDYIVQFIVEDEEDFAALDIAFEKGEADRRKVWLYPEEN